MSHADFISPKGYKDHIGFFGASCFDCDALAHKYGDENDDYYTPHTPFLDTFKYLQGYYKFLPDGPDTARITVRTFANGQGRRSYNDFNIQEESGTFLDQLANAVVNVDTSIQGGFDSNQFKFDQIESTFDRTI